MEEAILSAGLQVLIYGERGAGKTSLANVCTSPYPRVNVFCPAKASFSDLCVSIMQEMDRSGYAEFVFDAANDVIGHRGRSLRLSNVTLNDLLFILPAGGIFCIVLDEFDRVEDVQVRKDVAELCKALSTARPNVTLVIVGVADTADDLLKGHQSNIRNLQQVHLGRMTPDELKAIIRRGEKILGITFDLVVENRILSLADRYPYYLHLLAANSARFCLERQGKSVNRDDFNEALKWASQNGDQALSDTYAVAVASAHGTQIHRRILWVMAEMESALASTGQIAEAVNALAKQEGDVSVTPQAVGSAIKLLTKPVRGQVLVNRNNGHYRFANPLMRGFIRMLRESQQ